MIAVGDDHITYYGRDITIEAQLSVQLSEVSGCLLSQAAGWLKPMQTSTYDTIDVMEAIHMSQTFVNCRQKR